jgi:thiamine-phosphate pyrophosphorylase
MITDRRRLGQDAEAALIRRVAVAARAGIHLVQIRERDLADGRLFTLVSQAVDAVRGTRTRVLVNDRMDIAIAAGAHGVHLRSDSVPAARVRAVTSSTFLIGRSVHAGDDVAGVAAEGAVDYLLFGTVFDTASKPNHRAAGVESLREAVQAARPVPVLAIGGITVRTAGQLAATGCSGFAAIGQFADGPEDELAVTVSRTLAAWNHPR